MSRNTESIYTEGKKELPAWMKTDKYAKYGSRSNNEKGSDKITDHDGEIAETSDQDNGDRTSEPVVDKYAKYGVAQDNRMDRLRRPDRKRPRENDDRYGERTQSSWGVREREKKDIEETEEVESEQQEETIEVSAYSNINATNPLNTYYQTFQSNIKRDGKDLNSIIRTHYNQRTYQSKHQGHRANSPIIKLRNFNNIIKYILIGEYSKKVDNAPFRLLDLCCGKGGDLNKMEFIKLDEYVGIDISDGSIREAFSRYNKNKKRFITNHRDSNKFNFEAFFATGDLFTQLVPEILEPSFPGIMENVFPIDVASCQFSLHYAFANESKLRCLINNVSKSLKSGGRFLGTCPSSDFIKTKIKSINPDSDEYSFGNELYQVKFHKKPPMDGDFTDQPFGNCYDYSLKDAIDNVPEYVVPFETLRKICEEHQMVLKVKKNFIEFFNQEIPKYFKKLNNHLIQSIRRTDGKYGVEGNEKEAVEFYLVFVFEKL